MTVPNDKPEPTLEPIPFFGHLNLDEPHKDEVWHFSVDPELGETKIEVKKTWEF